MKKFQQNIRRGSFAIGMLAICAGIPGHGQENTLYWTNNRSPETRNMQQRENWSDSAVSTDFAVAGPTADSNLVFNANARNTTDQTPTLAGGDRAYRSMTFLSSGITNIHRAPTGNTSAENTLTLTHGITVESGAGNVTFGGSDQRIFVIADQDMSITNNSASTLRFNNQLRAGGANNTTTTVTLDGSGSGATILNVTTDQSSGRQLALTIDRPNGRVDITGAGSYTGDTLIQSGQLRLMDGGSLTGTNVTVGANGSLVNRGTITDGNLHFTSTSQLAVNPNLTLLVNGSGTVSFETGFGVDSLDFNVAGWDALDLFTPYTLIGGTATFDLTNISNLGVENAAPVGTGRFAYFEEGSLQLTVIPEPSTILLVGVAFGCLFWTRRKHIRK